MKLKVGKSDSERIMYLSLHQDADSYVTLNVSSPVGDNHWAVLSLVVGEDNKLYVSKCRGVHDRDINTDDRGYIVIRDDDE